ncbi:MAG: YcdB/YcdC domain-containing protein [Anaerocolumna sp.]
MFRKKFLPLVLVGCMLTTGLPAAVYAADNTADSAVSIDIPVTGDSVVTGNSGQEPKAEDLERIIKTVKAKITIPEELAKFDYYFNSDNNGTGASWNLNWYTEDNSKRITIQSDQDGNIVRYYSDNNNSGNYVPKYFKADLKAAADKFIKKVAADISGKAEYAGATSEGAYSGQYNYQYQRVENGIPMPDNTITVGVNYETGKVTSYSSNWLYNVNIPSADTKITKEDAAEKIGKTVTMKLSYQNAYTTDKDGKTEIKAFLVYSPDNSYAAVDAKTGEVYTTQNEWIERDGATVYGDEKSDSVSDSGLTQQEVTKIDEIKGLISKEAAIKAITENKSLLLDDNLKSISASLYKKNNYSADDKDSKYVWSINLSDPREIKNEGSDTYRAYANASVDAKTGNIISFNSSIKDYYNMSKQEWESVKVKYNMEQGQKTLEDFLKIQIPDKFKNSVLSDHKESYVISYDNGKEVYGGYYYNYNRVNAGVEYPYNGINGAVDGVTGKIYSFSYNWNDNITFEAPKNIISADDAFDSYIANKGYHLVYEINNIHSYESAGQKIVSTGSYSVDSEVRLVYRTDISPATISPFTGKQLDYDGEEYVEPEDMYKYNDLNNTTSERNIRLLSEIGIGFKGSEFKPDKAITTKEITDFLNQAGIYYNNNKYKLSNDDSAITRLEASEFTVQILGYDSVAKLRNIYNTNFKDQSQISSEYLGYTALAQGLNLITSNNNNEFRPNDKLTRAEAADMIIAMLNVEK